MKNAKIVVAGLDNAGKTSILLTLSGGYDPSAIRPTRGADRERIMLFGIPVIRWDLGGQKKYRDSYFGEHAVIFNEVDLLIYVVDILDTPRHEESIQFYLKILEHFHDSHQTPSISVFLHKNDPKIRNTSEIQTIIKELKKQFRSHSEGYQIKFLHTSIFDKDSLIKASGQMILSQLNSILSQVEPGS
jgi:small GTP-binding protein